MPRRRSVDAHCFGVDRRPHLPDDDGPRGATANQASSGERRCTKPEKFHTKLTSCRTAKLRFNFLAAAVGRRQNAAAQESSRLPATRISGVMNGWDKDQLIDIGTVNSLLILLIPETSSVEHLRVNGADGISDVEGKVARVATSEPGGKRVSIERMG
jgi:hypothetical protein